MGDRRTGAGGSVVDGFARLYGFLHYAGYCRPKLWGCFLRLSLALLVDPCLDLARHPRDRSLCENSFLPGLGLSCSRRGNFLRLHRLA